MKITSFSAKQRPKGTRQPRGLIPIRRNMSQQIEKVALRCVITKCRNPEYRESTFPFKDVLPRSHSPLKLIYLRNDAECKPRNFFTVTFLTVLRQKFTQSKDVSHKTYTLHQVCFVASSLAISREPRIPNLVHIRSQVPKTECAERMV